MMRRFLVVLGTLVLGAGLLAACGDSDSSAESTAATDAPAALPTAIRVASDIPYAPFEFFEKPGSRTVVGFDVDIVNAVAEKAGIASVEFVDQGFDSIFISIPQGRFDMAASSITITPEREESAIFSDPYFAADQSIMVKKGSAIATEADLVGKTLGAQRGTTGADYAAKIEGATVKRYEEVDDAFIALETGRVDAVINDFAISAYATTTRTELEVVSEITTNESYGLMFPKESTALRDAFNAGLAEIRSDGTYAEIYRKWFNTDPSS
jgi:ABC-type amino acid transport substrate-binding protein